MAEPFNVEQFRRQMSGQANVQPPQADPAISVEGQPQPYQSAPMQMPQTQAQPRPYQPQIQMPQPQYAPQHYAPQAVAQPSAPPQHQGQTQPMPPQAWAPQQQMSQPQTPMHHMPPPPVFVPPPAPIAETVDEGPKTSRFSLKRSNKLKAPKVPKIKKHKKVKNQGADTSDIVHATNTSPAIIFMFGMATGIVCFLVGNMLMSSLLTDKSPQNFRDIQRQNAQTQQPVLPKSVQNAENALETKTP